jgi:hypothetical protein
LREPPLSFALRLSARSLCSVKAFVLVSRRTCSPGRRGTRRTGGAIVADGRRHAGSSARNVSRVDATVSVSGLRLSCVTRDGRDARRLLAMGSGTGGEVFRVSG